MAGEGLRESKSPFLRHGAAQPVAWEAWGAAAFERARSEDRPVLLDIGAVWCHWCHVMDRESYEDEGTAALINELFVPVKVDRDERPDVDVRYQRAVQAIARQGGWPLTAFLTPDGEVFYGGTYFPPRDAQGRPSFQRVLREVARLWREDRDRVREASAALRDQLAEAARSEVRPGDLDASLVDAAVAALVDVYDPRNGGFGRAPKFPNAGGLELLLDHGLETGEAGSLDVVTGTLDAMARGGIHDQLGGGFHRYATDSRWLVPHFEKMAYDNGPLLELYARAASSLDVPAYGDVARGIAEHYRDVAGELVAAGGFPASQDADVDGDDGDYWTWTHNEVRDALDGDEQAVRAATLRYGLDDPGSRMHLDPSRRVLFRSADAGAVAAELGLDEDVAGALLEDVARRLKAVRDRRPRPFVDETLYSGWVALVAAGHIAAARYLGEDDAGAAGLRALDRIRAEALDPGVGVARRVGDTSAGAYLQDQVHVARALLDAFEWTQRRELLQQAEQLVEIILDRYRDADGFLDRPRGAEAAVAALDAPSRSVADSPEPAPDAVAILCLARLDVLTGKARYGDAARTLAGRYAGTAAALAPHAGTFHQAVAWLTRPVTTVAVVEAEEAGPLFRAALRTYRPRTVVRRLQPDGEGTETLPPELAAMVTGESPRAYLCAGSTCAAPVVEAGALVSLMRGFRG